MRTEGHCKTVALTLWSIDCGLKDPADGDSIFLRNFDSQLRPHGFNCRNGGNVT